MTWLHLTCGSFQNSKSVLEEKLFSDVGYINASIKKLLTDIPFQDFENCFAQWLNRWEHCKELEEDYVEKC
jgi:hypothetical protein